MTKSFDIIDFGFKLGFFLLVGYIVSDYAHSLFPWLPVPIAMVIYTGLVLIKIGLDYFYGKD